jgi:ribosomal protein S18 acetylase RimI-like enzyme
MTPIGMTTEPELRLRAARPDEVDFFYAVRKEAFVSYFEQVFGPWLDAAQRPIAETDFAERPVEIVELGDARIGYLAIVRHADHWFLDEIALASRARGRGFGTRLVRSAMEAAKRAGLPLRLSVLHVNPAQRLYARLGFRVARLEPPRVAMVWP